LVSISLLSSPRGNGAPATRAMPNATHPSATSGWPLALAGSTPESLLGLDGFDTHAWIVWAREHADVPVFAVSLYLIVVFYVPQFVARPWPLRTAWAVWNLALSAFSALGAYRCVPHLVRALRADGLAHTLCAPPEEWYLRDETGTWVSLFIFSKIPELLDTAFLVLQRKEVIFLHWFHHITVLLYCWHAYVSDTATGLWFSSINYSVHAFMYLYYFLSISGGRLRTYARPLAPFITTVQLAQMVVGTAVTLEAARLKRAAPDRCSVDAVNSRLGLAMYLSYFVLFAMLFYNLYLKPTGKHARRKRADAPSARDGALDEKLCGVDLRGGDAAGFFHPSSSSSTDLHKLHQQ
jgi:elongation of very long chain fatty acids protein 6